MQEESKIWKIRTVKNYLDAHNHLLIGHAVEVNKLFVRLYCQTFHFRKNVNNLKDIKVGPCDYRIIPWARIELINELASEFDYQTARLVQTDEFTIVLTDDKHSCIIASTYDNNY